MEYVMLIMLGGVLMLTIIATVYYKLSIGDTVRNIYTNKMYIIFDIKVFNNEGHLMSYYTLINKHDVNDVINNIQDEVFHREYRKVIEW